MRFAHVSEGQWDEPADQQTLRVLDNEQRCFFLVLQVAVYSPADRLQPHRYKADEAYCVGTPEMPPVSCYLDMDAIIKVAKEAEVDAIHPGYGFLSENFTFARKCAEAGIVFIGPKPETIEVSTLVWTGHAMSTWTGHLSISKHDASLKSASCTALPVACFQFRLASIPQAC